MVLSIKKDKKLIRKSLKIIFSVILAEMIITAVGFLDVFMMGQYDEMHFSAIGIAAEVWLIFASPLLAFSTLFGILYSQYQKNKKNFQELLKINMLFSISLACFISFLMLTIGNYLSELFFLNNDYNQEETTKIKDLIFRYIKILAIGNFFATFSLHLLNPLVMTGKAHYFLYMSLVGLISNGIDNYLLIYVADLGIEGAGISTTISYFFQFIFAIIIFSKNRHIISNAFNFFILNKKIVIALFKRISIALFSIIMIWTYIFSSILITAQYGSKIMKSLSIAYSISGIMFSIMPGIKKLVGILIGKSLGKNSFQEAIDNSKKIVWIVVFITIIFSLISFILAFVIPQNTIKEEEYALKAKAIIIIFSAAILGYSLQTYYSALFEVAGKQIVPSIWNYFTPLWLQIPLSILVGPWVLNWNFINVFLFHHLIIYVVSLILFIMKKRNKWLINLNIEVT